MDDLSFFYSAKMVVVFILMLSSATLEAQRNENDKFFDLMTAIGEHLRGEFNEAEKALELDLNGANSFLEELHTFATHKIVTKNENANYHILKQLNDQRFSIYESINLLRATFDQAYATINFRDEEIYRRFTAKLGKQKHILIGKLPQIFMSLSYHIKSELIFNWRINGYLDKDKNCEYVMFFQNISENLMKMMSDKGIDPELHLESIDFKIQEYVQNDVEENCKKFDNEEAKIIFLNNVRYDLAINFEFNQRKDIYDRVEDLLSDWVGDWTMYRRNLLQLSEDAYLKKNASKMLNKIKHFIKNTNPETISIIDALIGKEIDQFNLVSLFDQIKSLVKVTIPKEQSNIRDTSGTIGK